jgi:hypothetical protein
MIALVTTYFLVFYILIPGVLFPLSHLLVRPAQALRTHPHPGSHLRRSRCPAAIRSRSLRRLESAGHATSSLPDRRKEPPQSAAQDYHRVAAILTSSDASKLLGNSLAGSSAESRSESGSAPVSAQTSDANWHSLNQSAPQTGSLPHLVFRPHRPRRRLFRPAGQKIWRLAEPRGHAIACGSGSSAPSSCPTSPSGTCCSPASTGPSKEDVDVSVDILQNDGILYQGRVADYFIDSDGKLTGILLENVSRFDREAYNDARKSLGNRTAHFVGSFLEGDSRLPLLYRLRARFPI